MRRLALTLAFVLLLGYIVHHPGMAVPAILIGGLVLLWLAAGAALGAVRLLKYGGRRARRDWRAGR